MEERPAHGTPLMPSQVRLKVLEDHARIRRQLREVRAAAEWARTGAPERAEPMRAEARSFADLFLRHLAMEEEVLVPTLREVDIWGDARADRVLQEHEEQRETFQELMNELEREQVAVSRVAQHVLSLADSIEADMIHEEETVLHEKLLKDDVINVDPCGG